MGGCRRPFLETGLANDGAQDIAAREVVIRGGFVVRGGAVGREYAGRFGCHDASGSRPAVIQFGIDIPYFFRTK